MRKILALFFATGMIVVLSPFGASAMSISPSVSEPGMPIVHVWDNCGVGSHRTAWGECVSNWAHGPGMRGCPYGYHIGNYVHTCIPNGYSDH
jgi:hypothetical protein